MQTTFTPYIGLLGGALIGFAAVLLLVANGRIAGISSIIGGLLTRPTTDIGWRIAFVCGLGLGACSYRLIAGEWFAVDSAATWPVMLIAGLFVGFGTRMGGGCTSGHGVCGLARLSPRSLVATLVFMASGMLTVFVTRHLLD
jgi:Predicted transporter component